MIGHANPTIRTTHTITTIIVLVHLLLRIHATDPLPVLVLLPMHVTVPLLALALIHLLVPVILHPRVLVRRLLLLALLAPRWKPVRFALRNLPLVRKRTVNLMNLWTSYMDYLFENDLMLSSMLAAFTVFPTLPKAFLNLNLVNHMPSRTLLLQQLHLVNPGWIVLYLLPQPFLPRTPSFAPVPQAASFVPKPITSFGNAPWRKNTSSPRRP
jgi:hypothetical protein